MSHDKTTADRIADAVHGLHDGGGTVIALHVDGDGRGRVAAAWRDEFVSWAYTDGGGLYGGHYYTDAVAAVTDAATR